jgi:hypothetical protein
MEFQLTRLILIDSYCPGKIGEIELGSHITINGTNGAGKTTLLRLLPMFFGESPSRIIRGDAVTERFGRYYFPSQASYVVFEYKRREQMALAVIHAEGSTDSVVYRFIDSGFRPELFNDGTSVVQSGALYRHLDKLGVSQSGPLTLHAYRQIIQNTATERDHRKLAARFAFTGAGKLKYIERIVTAILQKATTFYDLKRMIVSSMLDGDDAFSLQSGKKELLQFVKEYDAHQGLAAKSELMVSLNQSDQYRLSAESELSILHARFELLRAYCTKRVEELEALASRAKDDKRVIEDKYSKELIDLNDKKNAAASTVSAVKGSLIKLDELKQKYANELADDKRMKVESLPGLEDELKPLRERLQELLAAVKSLAETFDNMARDAKQNASNQQAKLKDDKLRITQTSSKLREERAERHQENVLAVRARQEPALEGLVDGVSRIRIEESALEVEVRTAQPEKNTEDALTAEREAQTEANAKLAELQDASEGLRSAEQKAKRAFEDTETQINDGERQSEKLQEELRKLLAADSAGEDTLLGALRKSKADWTGNIGKLVSEDILLRDDLSPSFGEGDNFYGVSLDLSPLKAGRFASEEVLQDEIKLMRSRLENKTNQLAEDQKTLATQGEDLDRARRNVAQHDGLIVIAKGAKLAADGRVQSAEIVVRKSKELAIARSESRLKDCRQRLDVATGNVEAMKKAHRDELAAVEVAAKGELDRIKRDEDAEFAEIESKKRVIESALEKVLAGIAKDREAALANKGVTPETLNAMETRIKVVEAQIVEANSYRPYVQSYLDWLGASWPRRPALQQELQEAEAEVTAHKLRIDNAVKERDLSVAQQQAIINDLDKQADTTNGTANRARAKLFLLKPWAPNAETLEAGHQESTSVAALEDDYERLNKVLNEHREKIQKGVNDILRQMGAIEGTGPQKYMSAILTSPGCPRQGRDHEWLEFLRGWFGGEEAAHKTSLIQLGRSQAMAISAFKKNLADFKRNVSIFAADLSANLEQGKVFDAIADVRIHINTHIDTQNYWPAVEALNYEYEQWHAQESASMPPQSFMKAIKEVATILSDEKGLVASPADLITLKISANVNNQGSRTASNENELATMSSNGLSYIILCVIFMGFVNRIRRKEQVSIPFVLDELLTLDFDNAKTLIDLFARNNIIAISAFPGTGGSEYAPLFSRSYVIQTGRRIALVQLEKDAEVDHV